MNIIQILSRPKILDSLIFNLTSGLHKKYLTRKREHSAPDSIKSSEEKDSINVCADPKNKVGPLVKISVVLFTVASQELRDQYVFRIQ
jgi:hypothetical protein